MKKTLLFTNNLKSLLPFLVFCLCFTGGWSQTNLVLNGTGDEYTNTTSDNADAWDMTPSSTVVDNTGATIDSPYFVLWNNSALDTWLRDTYNSGDDVDEQPGSTSDGTYSGATKTRALKLYGDGSPVVSESTRRLYQKIVVEAGVSYTFSIDSRSEAENIPTEIFILNEEITTEVGLENGVADSRVDHYLNITNDFNSSKGGEGDNTFTTSTFDFTASTTTVVIYVRAKLANSGETEVFYDNISLVKKTTASVNDFFSSKVNVYPNPAKEFLQIKTTEKITAIEMYNLIGKKVLETTSLLDNKVNISSLPKGVYLLKLKNDTEVAVKKIVIQ